ncbi:membrane protein [Borreliella burgdorferi WI91-23]|nr:membrane protein [Borreliella burgdorferi WI91-23]
MIKAVKKRKEGNMLKDLNTNQGLNLGGWICFYCIVIVLIFIGALK